MTTSACSSESTRSNAAAASRDRQQQHHYVNLKDLDDSVSALKSLGQQQLPSDFLTTASLLSAMHHNTAPASTRAEPSEYGKLTAYQLHNHERRCSLGDDSESAKQHLRHGIDENENEMVYKPWTSLMYDVNLVEKREVSMSQTTRRQSLDSTGGFMDSHSSCSRMDQFS